MSGTEKSGRAKGVKNGETRGKILLALKQEPMMANQLIELMGVTYETVYKHIKKLKAAKLVRICEWEPNGSGYSPVFSFGSLPDKPKPLAKTDAELGILSYYRNRAVRLAKKRASRRKPTVWDGLIYGRAP